MSTCCDSVEAVSLKKSKQNGQQDLRERECTANIDETTSGVDKMPYVHTLGVFSDIYLGEKIIIIQITMNYLFNQIPVK